MQLRTDEEALSDLVSSLLEKRGLTESDAIRAFLSPDYAVHTHSPDLLFGIQAAIERFFKAYESNERIAIYADFDCDGIPGAAVLSDFMTKIGYENFEVYLPHRDREGYGFHPEAISALAGRGVKLIITVDVGTTAIDAVAFARTQGVDVIVTDHHEILGAVPDAVAVLNPKLAPYPFPHLCGAAVTFKFVQALLAAGKNRKIDAFLAVTDGWEKWLLDLVAIATVADMVSLTGENRTLVHWGLAVLRKSPRPGINALCNKLRLRKSDITEDDIGFTIAPRINAASRMDAPDLAFRLLTVRAKDEAEALADKLESLNRSRKGVVGGIVREAKRHVRTRFADTDRVVVLGDPEWKPALLGLAANSIVEERGGLVCMWGRDAKGRIKGSCRSDGSISVVDVFQAAQDTFEEYGGHAASGGFSIAHERVHSLPETLQTLAATLDRKEVPVSLDHDARLGLKEVGSRLLGDVTKLAPFGIGNPKPVFQIYNCLITDVRTFGKEKNHIELALECKDTGARCRAYDFFRSASDFSHTPEQGKDAAILATVERDSFRGGVALRLVEVLPAS